MIVTFRALPPWPKDLPLPLRRLLRSHCPDGPAICLLEGFNKMIQKSSAAPKTALFSVYSSQQQLRTFKTALCWPGCSLRDESTCILRLSNGHHVSEEGHPLHLPELSGKPQVYSCNSCFEVLVGFSFLQ